MKRYKYKTKVSGNIFFLMFLGAFAVFFLFKAINNEVGLIINGVITLNPKGADIFFWSLFAFFAFLLLCIIALMLFAKDSEANFLSISKEGILIPKRLFDKEKFIPFSDISEIRLTEVSGAEFLEIHHSKRTESIVKSMLSKEDFDEIKEILTAALKRIGSD